MQFNSLAFAGFLLAAFALYWALPHRFRWGVLLVANYLFYLSWGFPYVFLLLATTALSYVAALRLEHAATAQHKKRILICALVVCLGILFVFKYFNWALSGLSTLFAIFALPLHMTTLKLLVPLGLSFYTFQTVGYLIDVYRKTSPAEKHFGQYAVFVSFFPSILSGPIERAHNLLPQIKQQHTFEYATTTYGLKLMAWGFFKKLALADVIAPLIDPVFADIHTYSGFVLVAAVVLFALQIYCDFSGYSDIARGVAQLFGIKLTVNFKAPYFSHNLKEFWQRWHISLSTWLRDYVYIPLGGNQKSKLRTQLNLILTFLISGLWHGANLTFLVWGLIHGVGSAISNLFSKKALPRFAVLQRAHGRRLRAGIALVLTFVFCCFAWIFFRANTVSDAGYLIGHLFVGIRDPLSYLRDGLHLLLPLPIARIELVLACVILVFVDAASLKTNVIKRIAILPQGVRWTLYISFVLLIMALMPTGQSSFLYFKF